MNNIAVLGPNPAWQKTLFFDRFDIRKINRAKEMQQFRPARGSTSAGLRPAIPGRSADWSSSPAAKTAVRRQVPARCAKLEQPTDVRTMGSSEKMRKRNNTIKF